MSISKQPHAFMWPGLLPGPVTSPDSPAPGVSLPVRNKTLEVPPPL